METVLFPFVPSALLESFLIKQQTEMIQMDYINLLHNTNSLISENGYVQIEVMKDEIISVIETTKDKQHNAHQPYLFVDLATFNLYIDIIAGQYNKMNVLGGRIDKIGKDKLNSNVPYFTYIEPNDLIQLIKYTKPHRVIHKLPNRYYGQAEHAHSPIYSPEPKSISSIQLNHIR